MLVLTIVFAIALGAIIALIATFAESIENKILQCITYIGGIFIIIGSIMLMCLLLSLYYKP
jgi:hypothetical protein